MEVTVTNITTEVEVEAGYDLFEIVVTATDSITMQGVESVTGDGVDNTDPLNPVISYPTPADIGAVESVTGDGVDNTDPTNPVLTFPTTGQLTEDSNYRFVTDAQLTVIGNTSGTNTGDQDISGIAANAQAIEDLKVKQITGITVTAASFSLVSGLYEASISNANILSTSSVEVIPENATIAIVEAANFLPYNVAIAGSVKVFCKNLPTGNFTVTINIQPVI